jgi:hypothetical protein
MTTDGVSPTPAAGHGGRPKRTPQRSNPDLAKIAAVLVAIIGLLAGGAAIAHYPGWLPLTQYWLASGGVLMLLAHAWEGRAALATTKHRCFVTCWLIILISCAAASPTLWWTIVCLAAFWLFVLVEVRCTIEMPEDPRAKKLVRNIGKWKVALGYRHAKSALPATVAAVIALSGLAGTGLAATHPHHSHETQNGGKTPRPKSPSLQPPSKKELPKHSTPAPSHSAEPTPTSWHCPRQTYPEAPWAAEPIRELLNGSSKLGPEEEGCVERLKLENENAYGLVWGLGIKPDTKLDLSLVFYDPRIAPEPGIVIAPAISNLEELIATYGGVAPDGGRFSRYKAGSGDYYLINTYESGTAIVVRAHSGASSESPSYTTLRPSVGVAMLTVTKVLEVWQWPTKEKQTNAAGEIVYQLTAAGGEQPDATITFNPKTGSALWRSPWKNYPYPAIQRDLDPQEVERYVREYLLKLSSKQTRHRGPVK